ncbi:MAG: D-alanyl-D-alanine carboxypeptidase family protein [Lachnospiraceae bacterium]
MKQETREAYEEEKRRIRRRAMIERARQEKLRRQKIRKIILLALPVMVVGIIVLIVVLSAPKKTKDVPNPIEQQEMRNKPEGIEKPVTEPEEGIEDLITETETSEEGTGSKTDTPGLESVFLQVSSVLSADYVKLPPLQASVTDNTGGFPETVISENGILIDLEKEEIIAMKDPYAKISPASMTKILTILVAAEHIENLEDTFTITIGITDYSFSNDCSNVGFEVGEVVTIQDLFYGTILPSGADAALGLAIYTAGSHEAFVDMMNEKLEELGLSDTAHFTNCVGLYDKEHYCSVYDMAVILKAAYDNPLCRSVLSAHTYTTSATEEHPEGILLSNWFLRRIEDKDTHGEVLCAKTGYVVQSKNCAASLAEDIAGRKYLCVTAGSTSSWRCIYDHVDIYAKYLRGE